MIKFVCASCGERLSVPDQRIDQDIECPVCHGINRIKASSSPEPVEEPPAIAPAEIPTPAPTFVLPAPTRVAEAPRPVTAPSGALEVWRVPHAVRVALLIVAVLAIVGGLYLGLMLVVRLAVPAQ